MKKPRRLYNDISFYIEGGHLLNVNQLVQTNFKINQKVSKVVQLVKRC